MNPAWTGWVAKHTGNASYRQIARRLGVTPTAVAHWVNDEPTVGAVVRIALAYHAPVIEGLIAAGVVGEAEVQGLFSLSRVPTDELAAELRRRQERQAS